MDPFNTVALSWNDEEEGAMNTMLSLAEVRLYAPFVRRVANIPVTLPLVETSVALRQ